MMMINWEEQPEKPNRDWMTSSVVTGDQKKTKSISRKEKAFFMVYACNFDLTANNPRSVTSFLLYTSTYFYIPHYLLFFE